MRSLTWPTASRLKLISNRLVPRGVPRRWRATELSATASPLPVHALVAHPRAARLTVGEPPAVGQQVVEQVVDGHGAQQVALVIDDGAAHQVVGGEVSG